MAEPPAAQGLTLRTSVGDFSLAEELAYPNGGRSRFFTRGTTAVIIDYDVCRASQDLPVFDYSLITSKQNEYVARYARVYRFLGEDMDSIERFLSADERRQGELVPGREKSPTGPTSPRQRRSSGPSRSTSPTSMVRTALAICGESMPLPTSTGTTATSTIWCTRETA